MSLCKAIKQYWTVNNKSHVLDKKFYINEELEKLFGGNVWGYIAIFLFGVVASILAMAII